MEKPNIVQLNNKYINDEKIKKRYEERLIYQTNDIQTIYISNTIKLCKKKSCLMKET